MTTPTYQHAVEWIAFNDDPDEMRVSRVAGYTTTKLVADIFGVSEHKVARDVVTVRKAG
jgi:hypothetical protein